MQNPVNLVRGKMSDVVDENSVEAFRRIVLHMRYSDISNAGHMVVGDRNDAFILEGAGFLDRLKHNENRG